ncbi:lipoprotein BA_5634 family protein [Bacillus haimaensis]|uniref:lipoprotein BA_5634 family protein n=1 Tax=Bacillus haimaensis TaxID=3160967 RepID=UPI003AA7ED6F
MKKGIILLLIILLLVLISIVLLGVFPKSDKMAAPRNGLLLVGEKQELEAVVQEHGNEIKKVYTYTVKEAKIKQDESEVGTLILNQTTAEEMVSLGLFREARNTDDIAISDPLPAMPKMKEGKGTLSTISKFKDLTSVDIGGRTLPVHYETNSWLGYTRYTEHHRFIIIVDNETFEQLTTARDNTMTIVRFKKDYGQLTDIEGNGTGAVKSNTDLLRLTKKMEEHVQYLWPVSFKESKEGK